MKVNLKDYGIELHLVRHGQYNLNKIGGWTDDSLSKEGIEEVRLLLDKIDNDYDVFLSSDLVRAKETTLILNEKLNKNIIFDQRFREIDCGELNNMTIDEFINTYPHDYFQKMQMSDEFKGGESQNSFFDRIKQSFLELLEENKGKKILLVTHGGVITVIMCLLNGQNYDNKVHFDIKTGDIIKLK